MLEAEMNKLLPARPNKEFENLEFLRESKSSSPSRPSLNTLEAPSCGGIEREKVSGGELLLESSSSGGGGLSSAPTVGSSKLVNINPLLMASMDDLNLTKQSKHGSNPRSRKISANLPVQGNNYSGKKSLIRIFILIFI
jgi:hypothetical protein